MIFLESFVIRSWY